MATDDRVAFYLRHRTLIEAWAALREQASTELEEALIRAVGIVRQRPATPEIIEDDLGPFPVYGIDLEMQDTEPGKVLVALGWTRGEPLSPTGASWPYMGVKIPNATKRDALYIKVRDLLRDAARERRWSQSEAGWVWWDYVRLEADETDLDDYAIRAVEALVRAWAAMRSVTTSSRTDLR
ncbi:MAG: hypothetical protein WAK76_04575 [Trebonia sp.]